MLRTRFILIASLLVLSQLALAQDRALIAEGDNVGKKMNGDKVLGHRKLWRLSTGEYEAVESSAQNPSLTQTFRFDSQFLPAGYSFELGPFPKDVTDRNRSLARLSHSMSVSCDYKPQELRCESNLDGRRSIASLPAKSPYVFVPGEFYSFDFIWFLTGVVHLVERYDSQDDIVNVCVMTDNESNHNEIALKADEPIHLVFTGEESAQVMGKTQQVRKYEGWGASDLSIVREPRRD